MTTFSPSVIAREFDFSDYAIRASTTILGVVGFSSKGPAGVPVIIGSERELIDTFGLPTVEKVGTEYATSNMILPCIHYLREGNQLVIVRANGSPATASLVVENDAVSATLFTIFAISPGAWPTTDAVTIDIVAGSLGGNYFKLNVKVGGTVREQYDNLTLDADDLTNWPGERINGKSFLVTIEENSGISGQVPAPYSGDALVGGSNGTTLVADMVTALEQFRDRELVTINLLITPGAARELNDATQVVARAALQLCESRGECHYIMDTLYTATTAQVMRDSVNGISGYGAAFDTSYASAYGPWCQVYDAYNRKVVWTPPCGLIAGQYAYNDRVSQAWFAPAGLNRGKLRLVTALRTNLTNANLELMQAPRQVVNPIRNIIGEGATIWGQRTMQRRSSALDRVNARRMLNYAKATVLGATRVLLFEPNDDKTWRRFSQLVTPVIQNIKDTRGLYDFRVICDASTNPPDLIDQNIMSGKILLKPTKTAEQIIVDFNILSTGASFNEFI